MVEVENIISWLNFLFAISKMQLTRRKFMVERFGHSSTIYEQRI